MHLLLRTGTSCSMLVKTNVKLRLKQLSMVGLSISKNGFITAYQFLSFENWGWNKLVGRMPQLSIHQYPLEPKVLFKCSNLWVAAATSIEKCQMRDETMSVELVVPATQVLAHEVEMRWKQRQRGQLLPPWYSKKVRSSRSSRLTLWSFLNLALEIDCQSYERSDLLKHTDF